MMPFIPHLYANLSTFTTKYAKMHVYFKRIYQFFHIKALYLMNDNKMWKNWYI